MSLKENKKRKNKQQNKKKPKYNMFSNAFYAYKNIWKYDKFLVFSGIVGIPITLAFTAINTYMPSYIVGLFEEYSKFEKILIGICLYILITFILKICKMIIDIRSNNSAIKINLEMNADLKEACFRRDYFLILDKEIAEKENLAVQACANNHAAGVNFPVRFSGMVYNVLEFLLFGTIISVISPVVLIIVVLGVIVNFIMLKWEKERNGRTWKKRAITNKKLNYLNYYLNMDYGCGKDIRLYSLADFFKQLANKLKRQTVVEHYETERRNFIVNIVSFLMVCLRDLTAYYFLINLVLNNQLDVPTFMLSFAAVTQLSQVMVSIINGWGNIYEGSIQTSAYREYLAIPNVLKDTGRIEANIDDLYEIEFKNVSYKYPDNEDFTLKNINLIIKKKEKLAIVGLNGAGKSTLTMLMCGLLLPTEGEVLLNGKPVTSYNKYSLYNLFSFVAQKNALLPASIKDNIILKLPFDKEKFDDALKKADFYDKVNSLKEKENTPINKRVFANGIELSGGEIQKLILARAIYKKHAILVLDEPTSALDPIAENKMYNRYNEISVNATSIFISHRLASTRFCDRIILLDEGYIKETGTHDELIKLNGKYKELFDIQSKYYKEVLEDEE